ncbi:hemolysin family protein [Jeotgalibacillus haloalkalitolerans]|uniref:CNNM domain-containing protein n=1 Tax=Jeotgalibacillus haloalkalitolerans TaxID=3104292 RepID=A0ABU5KIY1_9BACL|nr:CNNM domain-containing protein [Jeotgalibacillus sp. HH7-29]MDZ5711104.1 CNNM domain-containing protein [Jeotgalibacillus sp. HH7-29]
MEFIAIAALLFASFFLSGSETALTAVNKMKVKTRAEQGDRAAEKLLKQVSKPDQMITTILIGNNISNILLPVLVTVIAIDYGIEVALATGILTVTLIIFSEVLPKTIAATFADRIAYIVAPVIRILMTIFKPITWFLSKFTNIVIRILSKGDIKEATITKEELRTMVDIASTEGTFLGDESLRIKGVLDFQKKDVGDAMKTPRVDIIGIPIETKYEEVRDYVIDNPYTRYPVYKENMDNIVGVFHSKQVIEWSLTPEKPLTEFMDNDPLFTVETTSIERIFKRMLQAKKHFAIVLDEYGGTLGIITHEDIIEAMIGQEIADENDDEEESWIDELTERTIVCHGKLNIHRLNEVFSTKIPEEQDVLAGFVLKEIGHLPEEGDEFDFQHLRFTVLEMEKNKITKVRIEKRVIDGIADDKDIES